jgi:hypothetical protein
MTWANPRPGVAIATIDVVSGEGYAIPVVVGITAGTQQ